MVLNIRRWREESIDQKLLACLRDNAEHVWCWDQYALNVVFAGQWGRMPLRWNQGAHIFIYPDAASSPLDEPEYQQLRDDPAVIHFTTEFKPWKYHPFHPLRDRFFAALDETRTVDHAVHDAQAVCRQGRSHHHYPNQRHPILGSARPAGPSRFDRRRTGDRDGSKAVRRPAFQPAQIQRAAYAAGELRF